ncbi:MAG: hypothetical protein ACRYFZ_28495 [Janthinobacterium lividum]
MTVDPATYPVDGLALPWGLTLAETAERLQTRTQLPPYGGWPNLRVACRSVFGLAAIEANLRAPALHKPVLQVSYELAAPPQFGGQPQEAAQWQQPLTDLLGAPTQAQAYTMPWSRGAGQVVYAARWQVGLVQVGLSVFGGVRQQAGGLAAAGLYLHWEDELSAARPFLAAAQTQALVLAAAAEQAAAPQVFRLQQQQTAFKMPANGASTAAPSQEATRLRQAQRALYHEGLCETPARLQAQLSAYEVALWAVPGQAAWAVSTQVDTVLLAADTLAAVELITLHPAKGSGNVQLRVGDLRLGDAYGSAALPALADALERQASYRVSRVEAIDA